MIGLSEQRAPAAIRGTASDDAWPVIANEFASVRVTIATCGRGARLVLQDMDSGAVVSLDPLDLRSFCLASPDEQAAWLRSGVYREPAGDAGL